MLQPSSSPIPKINLSRFEPEIKMKPVKIAMMGMTHGHTRKYYQTLI